ncbi:hypothetical protein ManeNPV_00091 [Malacosoma neustria nucleopolyhedrovirus]|uniref:hypothetical protein n=1 Tax=Malacosoma neustria nuclear polyhedrosis virus TaxID=38012 RepID=UPI000E35EFEE|nr:hypothetical protein ManeNPV_00091 [Malacosoma neustria nucleopolyhedrovirus]AUF81617.1 hypothetical protein ManeNPV_00091 [Malacosoma neustria nucleopolyhedrovirus]
MISFISLLLLFGNDARVVEATNRTALASDDFVTPSGLVTLKSQQNFKRLLGQNPELTSEILDEFVKELIEQFYSLEKDKNSECYSLYVRVFAFLLLLSIVVVLKLTFKRIYTVVKLKLKNRRLVQKHRSTKDTDNDGDAAALELLNTEKNENVICDKKKTITKLIENDIKTNETHQCCCSK